MDNPSNETAPEGKEKGPEGSKVNPPGNFSNLLLEMPLLALLDSPLGGADGVAGQHEEVTVSQGGHKDCVHGGEEEGEGTVAK